MCKIWLLIVFKYNICTKKGGGNGVNTKYNNTKYESKVTISRRKYNEQRITENLKLRILFFNKNKRAPKRSEDKEEQRLYNFYRRIDLSKYDNIDESLILKNKEIDEYDLLHKDFYKKQKMIATKQKYISRVIKDYYNFYLENGRFASDHNYKTKEEKSISKNYNGIVCFKAYYNKEHLYYINIINNIKQSKRKINNLLKIKRYINFCRNNSRQPVHSTEKDNDKIKRYENRLIINLENIDLDKIVIPYKLLEDFYDAIALVKEKESKEKIDAVNKLLEEVIWYMEKNKSSCYNDKELKIKYSDKMITCDHAMEVLRENVNYLDQNLKDIYNGFSFVRRKL